MTQNTSSVLYAVVVGTFQQIEIGAFEKAFINQLQNQFPEVILVIASAPIPSSKNHPLDIDTRKLMLEKEFPNAKIASFKKQISAQATSQALESAIAQVLVKVKLSAICLQGEQQSHSIRAPLSIRMG
jgi:nicotinamide mononucleotide adenylyltransferase